MLGTYTGGLDCCRCSKLGIGVVGVVGKEVYVHEKEHEGCDHDHREVHWVRETSLQTAHALKSRLFLDIVV